MDAIVTAGGRFKPGDPLFFATGIEKKALIPLAGKPMVTWVIEALRGSGQVDNIAVVGLHPNELDQSDARLYFVEPRSTLIDNILAGLEKLQALNPAIKKFLVFSSDIPLVTPEIVRGFITECGDQTNDLYYSVVEERSMEARFPNCRRTYVPVKGGRYCGGDAFLIDVAATHSNLELARNLVSARKSTLDQLRLAGLGFIVRFIFRRITIYEAARYVGYKTNLRAQAVDTKFAELAMDVDKLPQYQMVKAEFEQAAPSR